jgi:hypothetical protein
MFDQCEGERTTAVGGGSVAAASGHDDKDDGEYEGRGRRGEVPETAEPKAPFLAGYAASDKN